MDGDHYAVLGLSRDASKDEIKESFRRLALQFHPDKHAHSSAAVRDTATCRFKRASEAYDVLIDERKRADYNLRSRASTASDGFTGGYANYKSASSGYTRKYSYGSASASKIQIILQFLTTRAFLLNLAFAGALLGGTVLIDRSREVLWKAQNSGKSFEEAMESIEKAKACKENT